VLNEGAALTDVRCTATVTSSAEDVHCAPQHDLLGIYRIPAHEVRSAVALGASHSMLVPYILAVDGQSFLSRSCAYYDPGSHLAGAADLLEVLRLIDRREAGEAVPSLRRALVENLLNLYSAAMFRLWEHLTDHAESENAELSRLLDALNSAAVTLSEDLAGSAKPDWVETALPDLAPLSRCGSLSSSLRVFRELDSQVKIANELTLLRSALLNTHEEITALVVPLYGSMSLGIAAQAQLAQLRPGRRLAIHMVRLGFHDLASVRSMTSNGDVRLESITPPDRQTLLADSIAGQHVLIVDDNVGYGTTLRAAKSLVRQLGGNPITRSVETAWHLYHKSGRHDVSDAADLPGLRPNLHYRVQARLIDRLRAGDSAGYLQDPAHRVRGTLHQQMTAAYHLALGLGTWTSSQLAFMRTELAHAALMWNEPPVPSAAAHAPLRSVL